MDNRQKSTQLKEENSINEAKWMLLPVAFVGLVVFGTGLLASVVSA